MWRYFAMSAHDRPFAGAALSGGESAAPLTNRVGSYGWMSAIGLWVAAGAKNCAGYWAAAALYDRLSGLSDAELARRGLSRATLARDVRDTCDRSGDG
jgi:hypothetical protein